MLSKLEVSAVLTFSPDSVNLEAVGLALRTVVNEALATAIRTSRVPMPHTQLIAVSRDCTGRDRVFREVCARLASLDAGDERELDTLVRATARRAANLVNADGYEAQVNYLIDELGAEEARTQILQALEASNGDSETGS